ncbi:hypothetical protein G9F72_026545 [Clostridium estertheticum]|uniref:hypothetical protein n=1 Tax=Clostridium estertheticum TaxID=238834 RepID=UPI0013E92ED9|nr:hypothetical protein [Clostridium estertheticum]MBZ9689834.1 hypothetical protein [Clostridium estertheticum]
MKIGRFINVLLVNSEFLAKKVMQLGIRGLITFIFKACTGDILNKIRLSAIAKDNRYQWRLVG